MYRCVKKFPSIFTEIISNIPKKKVKDNVVSGFWWFVLTSHMYCSGRAGREGPGKCFRLYQESLFDKLPDSTVPEIKRLDLSNVILQLKALGVDDIFGFDFMEKPDEYV